MTTLAELRKGLKDTLATIDGIQPYATMPANPQTPAIAILPRSKTLLSWDHDHIYHFLVRLYVNAQDFTRAQTRFDVYSSNIEEVIDANPSLGGKAYSAQVMGWVEYADLVDVGQVTMLTGVLDVEVMA